MLVRQPLLDVTIKHRPAIGKHCGILAVRVIVNVQGELSTAMLRSTIFYNILDAL